MSASASSPLPGPSAPTAGVPRETGIGAAGRRAVRHLASDEAKTRAILRVARRIVHGACGAGMGLLAARAFLAPWMREEWEVLAMLLGVLGTFGAGFLVLLVGLARLRGTGPYPLAGWILAFGLLWITAEPLRDAGARVAWEARRPALDALAAEAEAAARLPGRDGAPSQAWQEARRRARSLGLELKEGAPPRIVAAWSVWGRVGYERVAADGTPPPRAERINGVPVRREPLGDGWWLVRTEWGGW